jgi:lipopolysaccharide transport system ATP-binding protein
MSDIAIRVESLSKQYRIGGPQAQYKTLRESLVDMAAAPARRLRSLGRPSPENETIWALKDVSFDVKRGEVVGIIGRNGAGKTTLLKILCRITEPTKGYAEIKGRVGSLLEVGTGFHPELTGRENVYLNGAILGMRRAEIDQKFDEIVAFSEIEKFLDTPVKRYSSGMYVRLAFSVAAHLEPEILLVDEVLAVGDAAFQKKCLGKMEGVAREGRTVLFVSHNMAAIENLCHKAFALDRGRLTMTGEPHDVVEAYLLALPARTSQPLSERPDRQGNGQLRFTEIVLRPGNGVPSDVVQCGEEWEVTVRYTSSADMLNHVAMSIGVFALSGQCMLILNNQMVGEPFDSIPPVGQFSCQVDRFPLAPGQYYLNLYCEVNGMVADWVQHATHVTVEAGDFFGTGRLPPPSHGGTLVDHAWEAQARAEGDGR